MDNEDIPELTIEPETSTITHEVLNDITSALTKQIAESVDKEIAKAYLSGATAVDICTELGWSIEDPNYGFRVVRHYTEEPTAIRDADYPIDRAEEYRIERYDCTDTPYDEFLDAIEQSPFVYEELLEELKAERTTALEREA